MLNLPTAQALLPALSVAPDEPLPSGASSRRINPDSPMHLNDARLKLRFHAEDRAFTLRTVRFLCWAIMILTPLASVLDLLSYPQLVEQLALLRFACSLCIAPILYLSYTHFGRRSYRALTVIVPMIPAVFLCLMIRETGDPASTYYAGLTLCMVALALLFHWTVAESIFVVVLVLSMYGLAVWAPVTRGLELHQLGDFYNNCVFLTMNAMLVVSGSFYNQNIRIREFFSRVEVDKRNKDLSRALTRLKETEQQLIQSEKLGSLGRMSAGIIHEINNPLSYTNQALFVLAKKVRKLPTDSREPLERIIGDVKEGVSRVSTIISDLRSFSHPDSGANTQIHLHAAVQHALRIMAKTTEDAGVQIHLEIDDDLSVIGDRNHLIQVLINLISNATAALKGRESPCVSLRASRDEQHTHLYVRDNGSGISKANLAKIFEPFFTTKDVGEGMGMGLSISFRLMQQMGGSISVSSEPDQWTQFTLSFQHSLPTHHP
jgi:two-component system, sensor histidine kinase PhcS